MLSKYRPDLVVGKLPEADPFQIAAQLPADVNNFGYDLDGSVIGYDDREFSDETMLFFYGVSQLDKFQFFVSNAGKSIRNSRANFLLAQIRQEIDPDFGLMTSAEACVSKPRSGIHHKAAQKFGIRLPESVFFGDLEFKDVFSAKRAGYAAAVLVEKYGEGDDKWVARFERPLQEKLVLPMMGVYQPLAGLHSS